MFKRIVFIILIITHLSFSADYYPMQVGNFWDYDGEDASLTLLLEVTEETLIGEDKISLFYATIFENDEILFEEPLYYLSRGNDVYILEDPTDTSYKEKFAQHTYKDGDFWIDEDGDTSHVTEYGTKTVPAGTFNSCFAVTSASGSASIFAPDVGLVSYMDSLGQQTTFLTEYDIQTKIANTFNEQNNNKFIMNNKNWHASPLVQIFDSKGRMIGSFQITDELSLQKKLNSLSSGTYFKVYKNEGSIRYIDKYTRF